MARKPTTSPADTQKRTQVVTVRLDPQLKYLAELAARKQRRPLSSYIEWAVEQSLNSVYPAHDAAQDFSAESFKEVASSLWDVDESDRFVKLALRYPDLLNHEEQRLWKLIRECGMIWKGRYAGAQNEWHWTVEEGSISWDALRKYWDIFYQVARGEVDASSLPDWNKQKPKPSLSQDLDDEIPF